MLPVRLVIVVTAQQGCDQNSAAFKSVVLVTQP